MESKRPGKSGRGRASSNPHVRRRARTRLTTDSNLALLGNVDSDVASLVLVLLFVIAPDVLRAELDSGLLGGRTDESDQGLNIDDSSKIRKTILPEMSKVMFSSRLKLNIPEIGATVLELLGSLTRVMEDQNLSSRIAEHDRNASWIALVRLDLVKHRAVAFGVEAQDSPFVD